VERVPLQYFRGSDAVNMKKILGRGALGVAPVQRQQDMDAYL